MPQMAPMMWQTIYIMTLILVMIMASKIFFIKVSISNSMGKEEVNSEMNTWKW